MIRKIASYPSIGVYYCVPDLKKQGWTLLRISEKNPSTGERTGLSGIELSHSNLYPEVISYFQSNFGIDLNGVGRKCLPRGRIEPPEEARADVPAHSWRILHGSDSASYLKYQIIDEFGLNDVNPEWLHVKFEEMEEADKKALIEQAPFMKDMFKRG